MREEIRRKQRGLSRYDDEYHVHTVKEPLRITAEVPGSKSITNRALLLAAMADGTTKLEGVLFSEDSEVFLHALSDLGFFVDVEKAKKSVKVVGLGGVLPKKKADIFVGSAGTAARFLTAFLAMSDGEYRLDSTEQMKKRPMRELLVVLETLGAEFVFEEEAYHFPFVVRGLKSKQGREIKSAEVSLNIDRSSQFLSAILLSAPLCISSLKIHLTGSRSARAYVEMTEQMMKEFGHIGVKRLGENEYEVDSSFVGEGNSYLYSSGTYEIESDVSAACYFYAMAALTGGTATVLRMKRDSLQGDMKFLHILEKMGCTLVWEKSADDGKDTEKNKNENLVLYGPKEKKLHGFDEDFSNFSDQALTAAAIAPFADAPVTIRGIAHIRGQESDRITVMETELRRMNIRCGSFADGITIYPGKPEGTKIQTHEDHRVAMAFAITGLKAEGIVIENPDCCQKTFPEYFEILEEIVRGRSSDRS